MCSDVGDSFAGHVDAEGIRVHWETDSEATTNPDRYVLRRLGCAACPMIVWQPQAVGSCGEAEAYEFFDASPPSGTSHYKVSVVNTADVEACSYTIEPHEP